jgi:hypothetical protein
VIEFKINDDLDYCRTLFCRYYTFSKKILQTIRNAPPLEVELFRYAVEVIPANNNNTVQRVLIEGEWQEEGFKYLLGEWRRVYFNSSVNWGEWVHIDAIINSILTSESIQEYLAGNWDRYIVIDKNNYKKRTWAGSIAKIDEIVEQIKTGTARIYGNKFV